MLTTRFLRLPVVAVPVCVAVMTIVWPRNEPIWADDLKVPQFEVDPLWPKPLPNHWIIGQTTGVSVDDHDHIWVTQHPGGSDESHSNTPAPPILEFDEAGNLIGHWGGPGAGYDWPQAVHGVTVDHKGNVWITGNGRGRPPSGSPAESAQSRDADGRNGGFQGYYHDTMVLKFTIDGKFLLQIGKAGQTQGSNDTENLRLPAKTFVDEAAKELFVADGYGNHRVIVFDSESGKYKRHWGAYGKMPNDASLGLYDVNAPPAQQFRNPVHCAQMSTDHLLYVCDRDNDRIQIFKPDGTFLKESFLKKETRGEHGTGSVWDIAFSADPRQAYVYVADGENDRVHVLDRKNLEILTSFGEGGRQPGEFHGIHGLATDSKGNLFTAESRLGQRLQKFVYKGLAPVRLKEQGALWPTRAAN
jgi:hypothetical protein